MVFKWCGDGTSVNEALRPGKIIWDVRAYVAPYGDCIHLAFALRPKTLCVLLALCRLAIKFPLKLSRNRGAWMENRFYDKVRAPLAWRHASNQSEISPFGILMKRDVCVCRNKFLLIRRDTFCHWLPGGLWRRCISLSCTRNSSRLFISGSIEAYFSADVLSSCS